jgi:hypothetical protein
LKPSSRILRLAAEQPTSAELEVLNVGAIGNEPIARCAEVLRQVPAGAARILVLDEHLTDAQPLQS